MAKAKLTYAVRETLAPGETAPTTIPVLTDRKAPVELEAILERCIDRGLVLGAKASAAHGIAERIAEQIYHTFCLGRGVSFGQYFYGRLYLNGTVGPNGSLTEANKINVRLYKGDDFRLTLSDFSLSFEGDATAPKLDFAISYTGGDGIGTRGEVVHGKKVGINGRNLWASGDTNAVTFTEIDADGEPQVVEVTAFDTNSPDVLTFDCPAALVSGKSYAVKVFRTDANGVTRSTATRTAVVTGAAPVPVDPPDLEFISSEGCGEGKINTDDDVYMYGSYLTLGSSGKVEVRLSSAAEGDPWTDVTTYVDGAMSDEHKIVLKGARGSETDSGVWNTLNHIGFGPMDPATFRVTTAGGSSMAQASMD